MNKPTIGAAVPSHAIEVALDHVRSGGRLLVPSNERCIVIDAKALSRWERAGRQLIKEDGDGYRLRSGRGSVYLYPGLLRFA